MCDPSDEQWRRIVDRIRLVLAVAVILIGAAYALGRITA